MRNVNGEACSALARSIVRRLRENGHAAWLVGGCVRDLLLGRTPGDFDVATSARPEELLRLFPGAGQVGAHFGVVLVGRTPGSPPGFRESAPAAGPAASGNSASAPGSFPQPGRALFPESADAHAGPALSGDVSPEPAAQVEVATFRSDLAYTDGRHPSGVQFESTPQQDACRRDFTINALFLDPDTGKVIDYVGGCADLSARTIRAIGDPALRFQEDHLRLLRAVRFAARLNFTIEPATFAAMQTLAPAIRNISVERVRDEISRILTEGGARRGFELLDASGLLQEVLPEVAALKGVQQPPEFHPEGDVWTHTLLMLEGLSSSSSGETPSLELALGVLLHDIGKPATFRVADRIRFDGHVEKGVEIARQMLNRLRFPNDVIHQVEALIASHMRFKDLPNMRESKLKRFLRMPKFEEHLELHRLDCLSSHGSLANYDFARAKQREVPPEQLRPAPLVTGNDLIAAGCKPGPAFGVALREAEDAQLEGRVTTKEAALQIAIGKIAEFYSTTLVTK